MRSIVRHALLLAALILPTLARAGDPDFAITSKTTLELEERGGRWVVFSQQSEKRTFLSKRSTYATSISLGEQYYNQISRIAAYYDGRAVPYYNFIEQSADLSDVFLSDFKQRKIIFSRSIRQGAEGELEYQRYYPSAVFMPIITVPNVETVKEYTVVVEHPRDVDVEFEVFCPNGAVPYTIDSTEPKETSITFRDVHAARDLADYPFNGYRAAVQVHARQGDREIVPSSPTEFARWYLGMFDQGPALPREADTLLRRQLDAARTPEGKLAVIHDYVRGTIRYIAEEDSANAFVPHNPALVLQRGYGDCKDRAYLVRTLARREGIDVKMVLVATSPQPKLSGVHITRYGHVICMYDGPSGRIYFDPTSRYTPFGSVPLGEIGSEGLVLDSTRAERVTVTAAQPAPTVEIAIAAKIDDLKNAKATVKLRGSALELGNGAADLRRAIDRENVLSNYITRYFSKLSFDYFEVQSRTDSVITLTCDADLSDFLIRSETRQYLSRMPFRVVTTGLLDRAGDSLPIYSDDPVRLAMTIDLEHPGYRADAATTTIGDGSDLAFTTSVASAGTDRSRISYGIAHLKTYHPASEKGAYLEFCRSLFQLKKNLYMLTRRGS